MTAAAPSLVAMTAAEYADYEHAFNLALGLNVRAARIAMGWSQPRLAAAAGYHHRVTLSRCERGKHAFRIGQLQRIADALGVTATALLPKL